MRLKKRPRHFIRSIFRACTAYTLVEIVVVVGILMLMSSLLLIYSQRGGKQVALFRDHARLVQEMYKARNAASAKEDFNRYAVCGYGVSVLDAHTYVSFRDLPAGAACPGNGIFDPGEEIERIKTDEVVTFRNYTQNTMFRFGLGGVLFNGVAARPGEEGGITLEYTDGQKVRVVINYNGQIFTQ